MSKNLIKRLSEPSTYAGLAVVALAAGLGAAEFAIYANAIAGLFAFIAIVKGDPGSAK